MAPPGTGIHPELEWGRFSLPRTPKFRGKIFWKINIFLDEILKEKLLTLMKKHKILIVKLPQDDRHPKTGHRRVKNPVIIITATRSEYGAYEQNVKREEQLVTIRDTFKHVCTDVYLDQCLTKLKKLIKDLVQTWLLPSIFYSVIQNY